MTPLNAILNLASVLKNKFNKVNTNNTNDFSNLIRDSVFYLEIIFSSGSMMQFLVQDMVDLMKIIKGNLDLNCTFHDFEKSCNEVI